jgi:hypothetical protein
MDLLERIRSIRSFTPDPVCRLKAHSESRRCLGSSSSRPVNAAFAADSCRLGDILLCKAHTEFGTGPENGGHAQRRNVGRLALWYEPSARRYDTRSTDPESTVVYWSCTPALLILDLFNAMRINRSENFGSASELGRHTQHHLMPLCWIAYWRSLSMSGPSAQAHSWV